MQEIYLTIVAIILSWNIYTSYLFASVVLKMKKMMRTDGAILEEMDKTIDKNIKKIVELEYELNKLKDKDTFVATENDNTSISGMQFGGRALPTKSKKRKK